MRDNQFAHCATAEQVLHSYAVMPDPEPGWCTEALARIAELSRPVVDEAARERVAEVLQVEFGGYTAMVMNCPGHVVCSWPI